MTFYMASVAELYYHKVPGGVPVLGVEGERGCPCGTSCIVSLRDELLSYLSIMYYNILKYTKYNIIYYNII